MDRSYWALVISLEASPASIVASTAITTGVAERIRPHIVCGTVALSSLGIVTFMFGPFPV